MSLWERVKGWFEQEGEHYVCEPIQETDRIEGEDGAGYGHEAAAYSHYFRVWMEDMHLGKSRAWFTDCFPAVHSSVRLRFGDHPQVTFAHVARAPEEALTDGVFNRFPVTELIPFNGGVVELEGSLLALKGTNHLDVGIGLLGEFASLVTAPLGQALTIAEKVAAGMEQLLAGSDGEVHLGLHQAFVSGGAGGNPLRGHYLAVVRTAADGFDAGSLRVVNGKLHQGPAGRSAPLKGHDYLLYRIAIRTERDDWRLSNIEEPLQKAITTLLEEGAAGREKARGYRQAALLAAVTSPDLTVPDRRRVATAIKEEYAEMEEIGRGAVAGGRRELADLVQARGGALADAEALGEMSIEEALAPVD